MKYSNLLLLNPLFLYSALKLKTRMTILKLMTYEALTISMA